MKPDFSRANSDKFDSELARRWNKTGFLGANTWQSYRDALPSEWEAHPEDPITGNQWMKLHEKNPLFLSKFMNAQGMPLSSRYSGLRSGAHSQLLLSIDRARHLGLLPVWGNPYFHRNLRTKMKPRVSHVTTDQVSAYKEQWIENERVKQHFQEIKKLSSEMKRLRGMKTVCYFVVFGLSVLDGEDVSLHRDIQTDCVVHSRAWYTPSALFPSSTRHNVIQECRTQTHNILFSGRGTHRRTSAFSFGCEPKTSVRPQNVSPRVGTCRPTRYLLTRAQLLRLHVEDTAPLGVVSHTHSHSALWEKASGGADQ